MKNIWCGAIIAIFLGVGAINATDTWIGAIHGTFTDDISIGVCYLDGDVLLQPSGNGTATIYAGGGDIDGSGYTLNIDVAAGRNFTFDITGADDLIFRGGAGSYLFNIVQTGAGTVTFKIKGGRTVTFAGTGDVNAGTRYFCQLNHGGLTPPVGIIWQYDISDAAALNKNAVISFENNSMFTFIAQDPVATSTEVGGLGIYTANTAAYTGTLALQIKDRAAFLIMGHQYNTSSLDVDLSILAGSAVHMQLLSNAGVSATKTPSAVNRFLVVNSNDVLPQLFCDPTRTLATVDGEQHGFIWGARAQVTLQDGTYLDYVSTTTNCDPLQSAESILQDRPASSVLKSRNASALIIDGAALDATYTTTVQVTMQGESGIFLRSAADQYGFTYFNSDLTDGQLSFTITPTSQPTGPGSIVLDIEAAFAALGGDLNAINVLSREVTPRGGLIEIGGSELCFPAFTFASDASNPDYLAQYGKACIMVNARTNLTDMIVRHDDFIHQVNATNTPAQSEPVYIGGDTFKLVRDEVIARPTIDLINSELRLHTSAALSGVDILTSPIEAGVADSSALRFYGNGRKVDNGTGRALVMGTDYGSYAYDGSTVIDGNCFLDVYQTVNSAAVTHELNLLTSWNTHDWISQIPVDADLDGQYSVHTLFLGNESNIQVGSQTVPDGLTLTNHPLLNINSNFFSFMAEGGVIGQAELAATTGQGGIFIDTYGTISIATNARANFSVMVVKGSPFATIDLPKSRAFFNDRVGISYWDLDLTQTVTIVPSGEHLAAFTLDWMAATKDYDGGFVPFDPTGDLVGTVDAATLYHIPMVAGQVDQFLVKRSRLGDQVHLMVDGGEIRDLLFLRGYDSAEAATGLVAVTNNGKLGIGNNESTRETVEASVQLGINGLTLVADGEGVVNLHTDVIVNNLCPILSGPNFGVGGVQTLTIQSTSDHEIRVKNGGVLDLTSFNAANKHLTVTGKVTIVLEPGAKLILSDNADVGGVITFSGQSRLVVDPAVFATTFTGSSVADMDDYRAKLIGTGTILFKEGAQAFVPKGSYLGIESDDDHSTNFLISITDGAQILLGTPEVYGGALQIGNTVSRATTVKVNMQFNGTGALFATYSQGFFGIGAGIADKRGATPNSWKLGNLYNVAQFSFTFNQGTVVHNRIYTGTSTEASLWAVGPATRYTTRITNMPSLHVLGGGNMVRVNQAAAKTYPVTTVASDTVGILASQPLLRDKESKLPELVALAASPTQANFFKFWRTDDIATKSMGACRANFATTSLAENRIGYVFDGAIIRVAARNIYGGAGGEVSPQPSLLNGAVNLNINLSTGVINKITELISNNESTSTTKRGRK